MEQEAADRICQLPDSILHVTIDIQEAVQTSVLSKRWRFLWSSMSELNFDFSRATRVNSADHLILQQSTDRFTHFVTEFLTHRDPDSAITKLHLLSRSNRVRVPAFVPGCVDYAVTHNVRNLDIEELRFRSTKFSDSFFTCKSLKQLTLRCFFHGFRLPREFSLPNLTALYVENTSFLHDGDVYTAVKEPFVGFPNLEKLSLHCCNVQSLVIVSPKLKVLEITFDKNYRFPTYPSMERIRAPALTSSKYQGYFPLECAEVELPILDRVYLETSEKIGRFNAGDRRHPPSKCVRMLQQCGNAGVVTLALNTLEVLETDLRLLERSPRPFPYMKRLKLTKGSQSDVQRPLRGVMDYLTACDASLVVAFPEDARVVESRNDEDGDEGLLQWLTKWDS